MVRKTRKYHTDLSDVEDATKTLTKPLLLDSERPHPPPPPPPPMTVSMIKSVVIMVEMLHERCNYMLHALY